MKRSLVFRTMVLIITLLSMQAFAEDIYPTSPDQNLTPGSTCDTPSSYRYQERIPYCEREVESDLKAEIIDDYNRKLGFKIQKREDYKIDHFIPLCLGGSNHKDNLWPQHKSLYAVTDKVEFITCGKLKSGRITQRMAIDLLRKAKLELGKSRK